MTRCRIRVSMCRDGIVRNHWTRERVEPMRDIRIAAAVCRCPLGRIERNLETVQEMTSRAARYGAAMVCFPELNVTGYGLGRALQDVALHANDPTLDRLAETAARTGIVVLAGLSEKAPGGLAYAAHWVFWPDGRRQAYHKVHLAPPETGVLCAGDRVPLFEAGGVRFGIQLCYDAHFPELSTRMALDGAEVIFVPHASPRGTAREKKASWQRHLKARAFDNGLFVVACNQSGGNGAGLSFPGLAMVIGPDGAVSASKSTIGDTLLLADLASDSLSRVRGHRMRYFLPHRRPGVYGGRGI